VNAKERLLAVQATLEERGAKDVKFYFGNTAERPLSQVATEVADAIQALLNNNVRPLEPFGDEPQA
jgi:hypothetical protein